MITIILLTISTVAWYIAAMFVGEDLKLLIMRLFLSLFNLICLSGVLIIYVARRIAAGKDQAVIEMIEKKQPSADRVTP